MLRLRPHHLLCNLCFQGKGYNEGFVQNFESIHATLKRPGTIIKTVACCDDICAKCPNKLDNLCRYEHDVIKIDNAYLAILQLKIDQTITLKHLKTKIKKLLTMHDFHNTCKKCSWYSLNICAPVICDLIQNQS